MAARGALPLSGKDLVTALFFLRHGADPEIKTQALATLKGLPATVLAPVMQDTSLHPRLLDFVAKLRLGDVAVMEPLLTNPAVSAATLAYVGGRAAGAVLSLVAHNDRRLKESPEIVAAILANPRAERALKFRLGWTDAPAPATLPGEEAAEAAGESGPEAETEAAAAAVEEEGFSKYQLALEMGVSEKIKMALTGDKEWRSIFLKDPNKLVSSAVLKNPRITDGEALAVAKNKSSSEELIRLITLNREWVKNYEMQKALVLHPKTPLPKALRYMNVLTEKDLKGLAKSRGVAQVIVNNARRMLVVKQKNR